MAMEINNLQKLQAGNGTQTILLIDAFNLFIRHYMANETINNKSEPIGGVVGFLKSLKYLTDVFKPRKVIVCYEAGGGSPRRKKIYPEYKANRAKMKELHKTMKNNNTVKSIKDTLKYDDDIKLKQLVLLNGLLKTMPVCQVFVKDVEGDDIVGYLAKEKYGKATPYQNYRKVIVSTDKDYYQLLDDENVIVYDMAKKAIIDAKHVKETFNISARNYCLAKAIVGDDSDNIFGVPGVGFKSAATRFTNLSSDTQDLTIEDIMVECQSKKDFIMVEEKKVNKKKAIVETKIKKKKSPKIYEDVLSCEDIIKRNWKLMYLNSSTMSWDQVQKIDTAVDNYVPVRDQLGTMKLLVQEGINLDFDINSFALQLQQLVMKTK